MSNANWLPEAQAKALTAEAAAGLVRSGQRVYVQGGCATPVDLIHKAAGWMLREAGKRCGKTCLTGFLDKHAATMPRTMLRYAIEHLPREEQQHYMSLKARLKAERTTS
jgi:hypothetical protein